MCYLHWCYTFCTGVTLLSANQNRVIFFMYIIKVRILQKNNYNRSVACDFSVIADSAFDLINYHLIARKC